MPMNHHAHKLSFDPHENILRIQLFKMCIDKIQNCMKQLLLTAILCAWCALSIAQVPQLIDYSAILRDSSGAKVKNREVSLRLSIVTDTTGNQVAFQEQHTDSTDAAGAITLQLGSGSNLIGKLDTIRWSSIPHYLRTEVDLNGGTNYQISGYTRLLSVPYALHAGIAEDADTVNEAENIELTLSAVGDTLYIGTSGLFILIPPIRLPIGYVACDANKPMVIQTVTSDSTGKVWMDRNMGASQVATASDDTLSYGDLYQWGRFADGHQCRYSDTTSQLATSSTPNSSDDWYGKFILMPQTSDPRDWLPSQNDNLWQGVGGINSPCPEGFRLPTEAEWKAEVDSWSSKNAAGAFASPLKLPTGGLRMHTDGDLDFLSWGTYWSSSVSDTRTLYLRLDSSTAAYQFATYRAFGCSVRCIKNTP